VSRAPRPRDPPAPKKRLQADVGGDPGDSSVKVPGVWFGGRVRSQVTVRRLNQGPSADDFTTESLTATGYFANLPAAQLGTHWFSSSVPCPVAPDAVQSAQVRPSTRMPSSAHASTIDGGCVLSRNGSALAQSATTPTAVTVVGELGAVVGDAAAVAGFAVGGELAVGACGAVAVVGEALADGAGEEAWPVGEAVAAGAELTAEPLWFAVHPATAPASAAQSASVLSVRFTSLETRFARDGCIASVRWPSS
jgi:hypothetical protein